MNVPKLQAAPSRALQLAYVGLIALAGGCSALHPASTATESFYFLDDAGAAPKTGATVPHEPRTGRPTLIVNPTHAASGFDSNRIIYVRAGHKMEYFAHSQWVDPPARMVAPLIVAALEGTTAFRAVVLTPSAAAGDLRLDVEIIRLQHEFSTSPSQVRFTLSAYLVDDKTRRVIARQDFDATVAATAGSPYGGVVAANEAVKNVLAQLATFCAQAASEWHAVAPN